MPEWLVETGNLTLLILVTVGTIVVGIWRREPWWVIAMTTLGVGCVWVALFWAFAIGGGAYWALLLGAAGATIATTAYERHRAQRNAGREG